MLLPPGQDLGQLPTLWVSQSFGVFDNVLTQGGQRRAAYGSTAVSWRQFTLGGRKPNTPYAACEQERAVFAS